MAQLSLRQVPQGAELVRTANGPPGFQVENVYVMAGIPRVMQQMLEALNN